jgi:hypothetical protein
VAAKKPARRRRRAGGTSAYRGVTKVNNGYQAQITFLGINHYLGKFRSPEDGAVAYDIAARHFYSEDDDRCNFGTGELRAGMAVVTPYGNGRILAVRNPPPPMLQDDDNEEQEEEEEEGREWGGGGGVAVVAVAAAAEGEVVAMDVSPAAAAAAANPPIYEVLLDWSIPRPQCVEAGGASGGASSSSSSSSSSSGKSAAGGVQLQRLFHKAYFGDASVLRSAVVDQEEVLAALASDGRSRSAARHAARRGGQLHGHGHSGGDAAAIAEAQAEGTRRSSRERRTTMEVKREAEERERAAREEDLKKRREAAAAAKEEAEAEAAKEAAEAAGLASEHAGMLSAKGHMAGGLLFGGIHGHGKKLTASAVAREIQHDTYLNPLRESAAKIAAGSSRRNTGPCTSRFRGVTQQPNGKWRAQIYRYGSMDSLGSFDSEVEAAVAYDTAARMYRGAGALCNFPDGVPGEDNAHVS